MEIHQMLCLSTAHLTLTTRELMDTDALPGSIFFPKSQHGWFMYVPEQQLLEAVSNDLPSDVIECLSFACKQGMQWLMFDSDGPVVEELALYEEIDLHPAINQAQDKMSMGFARSVLTQHLIQG